MMTVEKEVTKERSSDDKKSFSTSKLARRLKNPRKRKDDVCVGDEVSFVWEKQRVTGVVRFVGKTDFSAGTWCGAELDNPIGKNDGTVKGHTYFECPENHGVFVPLQKVKLVPRFTTSVPNLLEDSAVVGKRSASISHIPDEDMRIVVKSVSVNGVTPQPTKIPTKTFRQEKGPVESTPRVEGNVVVSSFTTPTPRKAVFAGLLDDLQYKQDFIMNNKQSTEESPTVSIEIPSPENFDKSVFAKLLEERLGVSSREEDPDITQFLGTSEKVEENDSTREKENESTKDEQTEETEEEETLHFSRRDKSRNSSKIPRKSSSAKDHEHLRKSSVKINSSSNVEASPLKFVSSNAKLPIKINSFKSPKVEPPKSPLKITKSPVRTPSRVEATKVFFQEKSSIPKPSNILRMHKMSGSVDFSGNNKKPTKRSNKEVKNNQQGDANDVPSVVMGNNNTAQTPDVTSFPNGPNDNKQRIAARTSITRFSPEKRVKKSEYADLLNQLKERNERITHMEETIEQAKVTSAETSGKLNKELEEKMNAVEDLQTKLNNNKNQLNKTSENVVALAIVLQYYLAQVNQVTTLLNNAITEKDKLELKNKQLQALGEEKNEEIEVLKTEVANEKVISEAYRDEISQKEKEYKQEVSRIEKENKKELEILNKSHENRLQEFSDKVRSQHENDVKELNEWHDLEVRKILEKHEHQIEDFENIKSNEMESLNILHEETMKEKEKEIEELTTTHQDESTDFQGRLDELKNENSILEVRINNISKETEKEARMQALLAPYKLLPAELESLKSVLELKNEEVKNLRVKNMQLERKMELYYELQTKYEILELANQSLTENLKKKQITEQNISTERDLLMEKFEREHRKCSQLSLANEELIWKASNPDLSFSTPNIYEAAEEPECSTPVRTASLPQSTMKNMKRRSMNFPISRTDYNEL